MTLIPWQNGKSMVLDVTCADTLAPCHVQSTSRVEKWVLQRQLVEGIGYDFIPKVLDRSVVDLWIKTEDKDSLELARRLIKEEGLLCGGSSGSAMYAALKAARDLDEHHKCVVLLPDGVRNYMTKLISDQWMEARRFKELPQNSQLWWWQVPVSRLSLVAPPMLPLEASTDEALRLLKQSDSPVITIMKDKSLVGVFTSDNVRKRISNHGASTSDTLDQFLIKKFYRVNQADSLGRVSRMLDIAHFVVVTRTAGAEITPIGIVDSSDLINFISHGPKMSNGKLV